MAKHHFEDRLWHIMPPEHLNEWEREELIALIACFDRSLDDLILQQIAAIWPISTALCFSILEELEKTLQRIAPADVPEWVRRILQIFEAEGLRAARAFMEDADNIYFQRMRGQESLVFEEVAGRLLPYVRGLSSRNLQLEAGSSAATDTTTVFLPGEISVFADAKQNFLLYKLIATFQWVLIDKDLYCHKKADYPALCADVARHYSTTPASEEIYLTCFFNSFPHPEYAREVYCLLQAVRSASFLKEHLPGLMADLQGVFDYFASMECERQSSQPYDVVSGLRFWLLAVCLGSGKPEVSRETAEVIKAVESPQVTSLDVMKATFRLCTLHGGATPDSEFPAPFVFQGILQPAAAHRARLARREENRTQFVEALASLLLPAPEKSQGPPSEGEEGLSQQPLPDSGITLMQFEPDREEQSKESADEIRYIRLDDQDLDMPEDIQQLSRDITEDLGGIPSTYIDSARKMAGGGMAGRNGEAMEQSEEVSVGEKMYDEWDFRRQGFRKNWCYLIEKKITATKGSFVAATLEKYRGQIVQLKRQFEMMRTQHRFIKRQRDGDDVDIEALIEALGDARAGQAPSDRLFIRLLRDERDIATLFLVDMSSSTEGWVGNALKESLIILCEAMDSLGDRYAIYGFSGMRRTRNIIFHVKDFEETYTDEIRGRIAAIAPVDYTRMGAPIRHFTKILGQIDAKVRLLLILTDGKPEDYDDYKGEYAIEDTRHALIEAKSAGIHPFCITIDRQAQDYMAHMFGEINYAFINDVRKLPLRVPEIYRTLTS
ncbi:MAG: VWA domain-containing protein [Desulfobulbaceae bacterium]|uniref:VWA domain-containing protein n=1 Tax=Candidatus Desulfobia pelagia TaxID=2841692 RepID=A0A8J6ND88_9BACT|nr:VWA domain-containing protein [Candidatus Desulfobia pelagia]